MAGRRRGPTQKVARLGQVDRALQNHDAEIGQKTAILLEAFHSRYVRPLEERVWWLEQWWGRRLYLRARIRAGELWAKWKARRQD
jgi:hypothetical protein